MQDQDVAASDPELATPSQADAAPEPEPAPSAPTQLDAAPMYAAASIAGASGIDATDDDVFNITVAQDDDDLVELEPFPAPGTQIPSIPLSTQQLENIVVSSRLHNRNPDPDNAVPTLPSLAPRPPARKRGRDQTQEEGVSPPQTSDPGSKRPRSSPQRRPTTRSQSTPLNEEEKREILKAAAIGIEGTSAISIHIMVSRKFRIPGFIKEIGTHAITYYFDERRRMITSHNENIRRAVEQHTAALREQFRGCGVVECPDCREQVPWGSILAHRLESCKKKRV